MLCGLSCGVRMSALLLMFSLRARYVPREAPSSIALNPMPLRARGLSSSVTGGLFGNADSSISEKPYGTRCVERSRVSIVRLMTPPLEAAVSIARKPYAPRVSGCGFSIVALAGRAALSMAAKPVSFIRLVGVELSHDADLVMMFAFCFASSNKGWKTAIAFSLPCCW